MVADARRLVRAWEVCDGDTHAGDEHAWTGPEDVGLGRAWEPPVRARARAAGGEPAGRRPSRGRGCRGPCFVRSEVSVGADKRGEHTPRRCDSEEEKKLGVFHHRPLPGVNERNIVAF